MPILQAQHPTKAFEIQPMDTVQIAGYFEGLRHKYPEAPIVQFGIYCSGNPGLRVFAV